MQPNGFERILVIGPSNASATRAGRISQRFLELETYRLMALRGLPVAKHLGPMLGQSEKTLLEITARLENKGASNEQLLDQRVALATGVERATAEHADRFSATRAYDALVSQRLAQLLEKLTRGQELQLRLQTTVEGLSIAAIG